MLLSIYVLFCCWICEEKKTIFCFSLLPFRCTWKYINAGCKSLKVTVVSVFWSTTSTSTSPSHLNGSRNAKIQMRPQTTLFNEIYDSSSNLWTWNLCPLPFSGDYLDPTNHVITCPLIPFMRIFWGFRAAWFSFRSCLCTAYSKKEQILQENENCGPYTFAAWTNIHQPRHVTLFQNSEKWILKKYMWWAVWGRNQGAPQKPIDRSWNLSEKNSLSSMLLLG